MKKTIIVFALIITIAFSACNSKKENKEQIDKSKIKVGLVFDVGGRGDKSFNDAAYKGLERSKKDFGIDFEVIDPGDGADRESALRKLASNPEINIVFGVGFIFTEDITKIANDFPNKKFGCIDYSANLNQRFLKTLLHWCLKKKKDHF